MDYITLEWDHDEEKKKNFIANLAPIVLFTYNRLSHTKQTVEALQKNIYARESELYIYSDAPRNEQATELVQQVRAYIKTVQGFKKITIIERDENWGLARNIIDGVTKIVSQYGKIIVLEDDIVTSSYFLKYMNDALEVYKNEKKVMQIGGYTFPIANLPEMFFIPCGDCWGWATWQDRWCFFERNPQKLLNDFSEEEIKRFSFDHINIFWQQVIENYKGRLYTWAIFFSAIIFKHKGVVLYHRFSLTKNIGVDSSGTNCGNDESYDVLVYDKEVKFPRVDIVESEANYEKYRKFLSGIG